MAVMPNIKTNLPQPGETKAQFITRVIRTLMKAGKSKDAAMSIALRIWDNYSQHSQVTPGQVDANVSFSGSQSNHKPVSNGGKVSYNPQVKQFAELSNKLDAQHQVTSTDPKFPFEFADNIQKSIMTGLAPLAKMVSMNGGGSSQFTEVVREIPNIQNETNQILSQIVQINGKIYEELTTIRSTGMQIKHTNRGRRAPNRSDYWTQQMALPKMNNFKAGRFIEQFVAAPGMESVLPSFMNTALNVGRVIANPIGSLKTIASNKVRKWSDTLRSMFDPRYQYSDPEKLKEASGVQSLKDDELLFKVQTETIPQALADLGDFDKQKIELLGNIYSVNRDQLKYLSNGQVEHTYTSNNIEKTVFNRDLGIYLSASKNKAYQDWAKSQQEGFLADQITFAQGRPGAKLINGILGVLNGFEKSFHGVTSQVSDADIRNSIDAYQRDREHFNMARESASNRIMEHVQTTNMSKGAQFENVYVRYDKNKNVIDTITESEYNDPNLPIDLKRQYTKTEYKRSVATSQHAGPFNEGSSVTNVIQELTGEIHKLANVIGTEFDKSGGRDLPFVGSMLERIIPNSWRDVTNQTTSESQFDKKFDNFFDQIDKTNALNSPRLTTQILSTSSLPQVLDRLKYEVFNKENEPLFVKVINFKDFPTYHSGGIITETGSQVYPIFDAGGDVSKYLSLINKGISSINGLLEGKPNEDKVDIRAQKGEYVLTKSETKSILSSLHGIERKLGKSGELYQVLSKISSLVPGVEKTENTDVKTELVKEKLERDQEERDKVQRDILDYTKKIYEFLKDHLDKLKNNKSKDDNKKDENKLNLWDDLKKYATGLATGIAGKKIWDFIKNPFKTFRNLYTEIAKNISKKVRAFKISLKKISRNIVKSFAGAKESISNFFTKSLPEAFESVKERLGKASEHIADLSRSLKDKLSSFKDSISEFGSSVKNKFSEAFENIPKLFDDLKTSISKKLNTIFKSIQDFSNSIWESTKKLGENVINKITDLGKSAKEFISNSLSKAWEGVKSVGKAGLEFGKESGKKIVSAVGKVGKGALNLGRQTISSVGSLGKSFAKGVWRNKGNLALAGVEIATLYSLAKQNAEKNNTSIDEEFDKLIETQQQYYTGHELTDEFDYSELNTIDISKRHNGGLVSVPKLHTGGQLEQVTKPHVYTSVELAKIKYQKMKDNYQKMIESGNYTVSPDGTVSGYPSPTPEATEFAKQMKETQIVSNVFPNGPVAGQPQNETAKLPVDTPFIPSTPGLIESKTPEVPILAQKDEYVLTKDETKSIIKSLNKLNKTFETRGTTHTLLKKISKSLYYLEERTKYKELHDDKDFNELITQPLKENKGLFSLFANSVRAAFGLPPLNKLDSPNGPVSSAAKSVNQSINKSSTPQSISPSSIPVLNRNTTSSTITSRSNQILTPHEFAKQNPNKTATELQRDWDKQYASNRTIISHQTSSGVIAPPIIPSTSQSKSSIQNLSKPYSQQSISPDGKVSSSVPPSPGNADVAKQMQNISTSGQDQSSSSNTNSAGSGMDRKRIEEGYKKLNKAPGVQMNYGPAMKAALGKLNADFMDKFGKPMYVTSGTRTMEKQAELYRRLGPGKAARPNPNAPHIKGYAIDINTPDVNKAESSGILAAAGMHRPFWPKGVGRTPPESWHIELKGYRQGKVDLNAEPNFESNNGKEQNLNQQTPDKSQGSGQANSNQYGESSNTNASQQSSGPSGGGDAVVTEGGALNNNPSSANQLPQSGLSQLGNSSTGQVGGNIQRMQNNQQLSNYTISSDGKVSSSVPPSPGNTDVAKQMQDVSNQVPQTAQGQTTQSGQVPSGATQIAGINHVLGSQFAKYESNTRGTRQISHNEKDPGGTSFGKYQFSSKKGSLKEFVDSLKNKNPEMYQKLNSQIGSATGGKHTPFADAWRSLADNPEFKQYEKEHAEKMFYHDALRRLNKQNPELAQRIKNNPALSEAYFSSSINHGPGGAKKVFERAFSSGISDEDFIKNIYQERIRYTGGHNLQHGLHNRFKSEVNDILKYNQQFKSGALNQQQKEDQSVSNQNANIQQLNNLPSELRDYAKIKQQYESGQLSQKDKAAFEAAQQSGQMQSMDQAIQAAQSGADKSTIDHYMQIAHRRSDEAMAAHGNESYSQPNRLHKTMYDCSSFVGRTLKEAGFDVNASMTTRDIANGALDKYFDKKAGWYRSGEDLQRGDIIWKEGHVEFYDGNEKSLGAHRKHHGVNSIKMTSNLKKTDAYTMRYRLKPEYRNAFTNGKFDPEKAAKIDANLQQKQTKEQQKLTDTGNRSISPDSNATSNQIPPSPGNQNYNQQTSPSALAGPPAELGNFQESVSGNASAISNLPGGLRPVTMSSNDVETSYGSPISLGGSYIPSHPIDFTSPNFAVNKYGSGLNIYQPHLNSKDPTLTDEYLKENGIPLRPDSDKNLKYALGGNLYDSATTPTVWQDRLLGAHDFNQAVNQQHGKGKFSSIDLQRGWDQQYAPSRLGLFGSKRQSNVRSAISSLNKDLFTQNDVHSDFQQSNIEQLNQQLHETASMNVPPQDELLNDSLPVQGGDSQTPLSAPSAPEPADAPIPGTVQNSRTPEDLQRGNIANTQKSNPRSADYATENIMLQIFRNQIVSLQQSANFYALGNNPMSAMHA